MFGLSTGEIILVVIIAFVLIGPEKLPEVARKWGKVFSEFQKGKEEVEDSLKGIVTESKDTPSKQNESLYGD